MVRRITAWTVAGRNGGSSGGPSQYAKALAAEGILVDLLSSALRVRVLDEETANIAARTGWGTLAQAMRHGHADPARGLDLPVERAFHQLRTLVAELA